MGKTLPMLYNHRMTKRTREHNEKIGKSLRARGAGTSPTKFCPKCERDLPRDAFQLRKNGHSYSYCVPCHRAYNAEKSKRYWDRTPEHRERAKEHNRRATLKRSYGISPEHYDDLLKKQGGVCAICGGGPKHPRKYLDVDHCHDSGEIRALLCGTCNTGIGFMGEDPTRLRAAADYLEGHSAKLVR